MKHSFDKTIVIALGGSIIYPDEIDSGFIKRFKEFIEEFIKEGYKFVLVVGGGKIGRVYQRAAHDVAPLADDDKDWLGIHVTRLNAHLIRTVFRDVADPVVIDSRYKMNELTHPVTVAGGWRPGWSTDFVAMALAADFKVPEVVIAGKPDAVYDRDPNENSKAKAFSELSWDKYRSLIPDKWSPGFHAPVDPVAARLADKEKLGAIIINGRDLDNFKALLIGEDFTGTIIE